MQKPTLRQLTEAHAAADLCGTLADAMRTPVLARCLEIIALALARPRPTKPHHRAANTSERAPQILRNSHN